MLPCVAHKATINTYTDPTYQSGIINVLAVFPARNARLAPSEARQINRKLSQAIYQRNKDVKVMSSTESITLLNENKLADDWATFLENYISSGVPDAVVLKEIGTALKIDAILQSEIVNIFQKDGIYGGNRGTTRVTVRFSLLNARTGKVIWEASSDGVRGTATTLEEAPPIIEAINLAVDKILSVLPPL